jgi:hypothetical protein
MKIIIRVKLYKRVKPDIQKIQIQSVISSPTAPRNEMQKTSIRSLVSYFLCHDMYSVRFLNQTPQKLVQLLTCANNRRRFESQVEHNLF